MSLSTVLRCSCFVVALPVLFVNADAQVVPGTGIKLTNVGDDFEDEAWEWIPNGAKSSREQDDMVRSPTGYSKNQRWFESPKRGMPDVAKRVDTPAGGLPGSKGALLLQTLNAGVPGRISYEMQQDDFIMACTSRIGAISVGRTPSCVARIWLPEFDKWENRSGTHFGYRIDCKTTITEKKRTFLFAKTEKKQEAYWPGFFIEFHSEHESRFDKDEAVLLIRSNHLGQEIRGPKLSPGWWTMGMTVTPDGRVHYYAKQGINDLTSADYLYSSFPYNYNAEYFATQFFNSVNHDDGRSWSTPFIVDDPAVYVLR